MSNLNGWWEGLELVQKAYYFVAIPSTFILLIQTFMTILGFGNDVVDLGIDADIDTDVDSGFEDATGFKFLSLQGIVAFFSMFGWTGVILSSNSINLLVILIVSLLAGFIAMIFVAAIIYLMSKLQDDGTLDYNNAIGVIGTVYLKIPKKRNGSGKIQIKVQDRYIEADAMCDDDSEIKTGAYVRVTDILDGNIMLVEKTGENDI
jgi:membrane protein implicated in regulation of membrane protease activity